MKAEILKRVAAGLSVNRLGADLPTFRSIMRARSNDAEFDAACKAAIAFAKSKRVPTSAMNAPIDHRKAKPDVIAALRRGLPIENLGEALPSYTTIRRWRRSDPVFDAECGEGLRIAAANRPRPTFHNVISIKTDAVIDRVMAAIAAGKQVRNLGPGLPHQNTIRKWRQNDPVFAAKLEAAVLATPQVYESKRFRHVDQMAKKTAVLASLKEGTLVARLGGSLPTKHTVLAWRRKDEAFNQAVTAILSTRPRLFGLNPRDAPLGMLLRHQLLSSSDVYAAADRAVGRWLPPDVRDDIISEVVLSVLEGETAPRDIPATAKAFTARYWRDNGDRRFQSFDAQRFDGSAATMHDLIAA